MLIPLNKKVWIIVVVDPGFPITATTFPGKKHQFFSALVKFELLSNNFNQKLDLRLIPQYAHIFTCSKF